MNIDGRVIVVTGGAHGIGAALCRAFHAAGAKAVAVVDIDAMGAAAVAAEVGGRGFGCDVTDEAAVAAMIRSVAETVGPIDLYCSNAGVLEPDLDFQNVASGANAGWARSWAVNVMAHVYAARALIPAMIGRGEGYFLTTVSAAGLLSQIGSASYSTTKHAALGFTESLAITHRDHGIKVSALCPMGVDTAMIRGARAVEPALQDGVLSPEAVAQATIAGLAAERFLILPHAQAADYAAAKARDYDRWIAGMAKLRRGMA